MMEIIDRFHKYQAVARSHEEQLFLTEKLRRQFLRPYTSCENGLPPGLASYGIGA
jgi:hypothetical protein